VSEEIPLRREMGCTRQEFLGWLPGATRGAPFEVTGNLVTIQTGAGTVQIRFIEAPPRRLGLLSLPVSAGVDSVPWAARGRARRISPTVRPVYPARRGLDKLAGADRCRLTTTTGKT